MSNESNATAEVEGEHGKAGFLHYATLGLVCAGVAGAAVFLGGGAASAAPDMSVVNTVSGSGLDLADTMKAIAFALIPLALGVFVVTRGWRIIKGFF